MESGTIVRWLKSVGDPVKKGEPLFELDTEKVTQEVEADASGTLLEILAGEGEEVPVGQAIAVIGEAGEQAPPKEEKKEEPEPPQEEEPEEAGAEAKPEPEPEPEPEAKEPEREQPARRDGAGGRVKASPLARRIARERGLDLAAIAGTGPEGRVVAEDVERAAASPGWAAPLPEAPGEVESVPLTGMRRTIARRMSESWQAPHFQISMSADMRNAIALRETLVERTAEDGIRPTFSDILTKACAVALLRHRDVNAHFADDEVLLFPTANVGIAVAVPHGLVVPVITSCERRTIPEIAAARADLVERTRAGKLQAQDLEGGTFTISNLGMFGVERFVAVLNPPQAAILAVGAIEERPVAEDGRVVVRPRMDLTLSCDHRTVDGATASRFLADVKAFVEQPGLML